MTLQISVFSLTVGGTLVLMGIDTRLDPLLMCLGVAGGWWALMYAQGDIPVVRRIGITLVSAVAAGAMAPGAAEVGIAWMKSAFPWWPPAATAKGAAVPLALFLGFLSYRVLGPRLMHVAETVKLPIGGPPNG